MVRSAEADLDAAPPTPAPRFAMASAALVYALATLSLAYPALAGRTILNSHSDQYLAGYAFREYAAAWLKSGHGFPQWNPFLQGGMPYIAAMHGDIFYPTFLLRMVMPTDAAMTWSFAIHLFLAGLFTYGFLRACGVGFYGSLVGGLAYMLSGPIAAYASPGHDGKLYVSALLPLALWMIVRGVGQGRAYAWGVLAFCVGLAVLSPHPQLLQYMLLLSGAFALYVAFATNDLVIPSEARNLHAAKLPRALAIKRLAHALVAVIVGGLMGAVQYLPVREYVAWSPRAGGKGWADAVSYSMPPEEVLNAFVPQFSGMLERYWGRNGIHWHSEYAGVVVLILAGAGLFYAGARRGFRWFWGVTFIIALLWALGGYTPFFYIVYYLVPGTKYFRAPSTIMYVAMFAVAVFAALGAERVLTAPRSVTRKFTIGWTAAIVLLALLIAAGLPGAVAEYVTSSMASAGYDSNMLASLLERARDNQGAATAGALRTTIFALLAIGVMWASANRMESRRAISWALAALLAIDLWTVERHYWIFAPPASQLYATDAAIDAMRAENARDPGRVFAWDPLRLSAYRDPYFGTNPAQGYDGMMVHRLRSVTGYHGNELGRYQAMLDGAFANGAVMSPAFWRHENVHFFYTTLPDSMMPQLVSQLRLNGSFARIAGPVKNAAGSTVYLYRMPGANPAAWVASVMVKGSDDQALATVMDARFEPARAAIVDTSAAIQAAQPTTVPEPSSVQARVTRMEPGQIDVQLDGTSANGAALVVSENYFPGWRATVDGRTAPTLRANYNLIGIPLPAGARSVQLRFVDAAYGTGKAVTIVAVVIALAALLAGIVIDRRPPRVVTAKA